MKILAAAFLCLVVAACGFRLRGTADVPLEALHGPGATSGIAFDLKRNIRAGTKARVVDDPKEAETVRTQHHDEPRFIYSKGTPRMMEKAPVFNHSDAELIMLESLVGRSTPFAFSYTRY